jgi:aspartate 1-decarboxylase
MRVIKAFNKQEHGQVLILLVLIIFAFASFGIVPLLSFMTTGLVTAKNQGQHVQEIYAADRSAESAQRYAAAAEAVAVRITRVTCPRCGKSTDQEGLLCLECSARDAMDKADILPFEQVHVLNVNTGARFTTYAIEGEAGQVELNGAAARLAQPGDVVIVLTYCQLTDEEARTHHPRLVYVDEYNRLKRVRHGAHNLALGE